MNIIRMEFACVDMHDDCFNVNKIFMMYSIFGQQ